MKKTRRVLTFLLCIAMVISVVPSSAKAEEGTFVLLSTGDIIYTSLAEAVATAETTDTITLTGTYTVTESVQIPLTSNITLQGANDSSTIIRGDGFTGAMINLGSATSGATGTSGLTLQNIIIDGGRESGLTATAAMIVLNRYGTAQTLALNSGSILQNNNNTTASASANLTAGGAICLYRNANNTVTIDGGTITNNSATSGGAIVGGDTAGTINLISGTISNNSATSGGGLYLYSGNLIMTGGTISNNVATTSGGAIYDRTTTVSILGGAITGNTAGTSGSAIFLNSYSTKLVIGSGTNISGDVYLTLPLPGDVNAVAGTATFIKIASALSNPLRIVTAESREYEWFAESQDSYTITSADAAKLVYCGVGTWYFGLDTSVNKIKLTATEPEPPTSPPDPTGIDVSAHYGGTITSVGEDGQYTVAKSVDNYVIDTLFVDGAEVSAAHGLATYTTTVAPERSISASFAHTINFQTPDHGTLSVVRVVGSTGVQSGEIVHDGDLLIITAVPGDGYELDELTLVGLVATSNTNEYEVLAAQGEATPSVSAAFTAVQQQPQTYAVTVANDITNGSIGVDADEAEAGTTVTVTVDPTGGYRLKADTLTVTKAGGGTVTPSGSGSSYTFEMPGANVTITAEFELIPFESPLWTGGGTSDSPYVITTPEGFVALRDAVNAGHAYAGVYFELGCDIDLTADTHFLPVGKYIASGYADNRYFSGVFDGNGKTISVTINDTTTATGAYIALFSALDGATIKNLTLDGSVWGYDYVGGIAASAKNTLIENCVNDAAVTASDEGVAGIVSQTFGGVTVRGCVNNGAIVVVTKSSAAGIAAKAVSGTLTIERCINNGSVSGTSSNSTNSAIAGIESTAGEGAVITVTECGNTGSISGLSASGIGGGTISRSYNTGTITAHGDNALAGGIAVGSQPSVTNCYNTGTVTATGSSSIAGGIVARAYVGSPATSVTNCYSSGSVTATTAGAIYGNAMTLAPTITNSYYLQGSAAVSHNGANVNGMAAAKTSGELQILAGTLGEAFKPQGFGYPLLDWETETDYVKAITEAAGGAVAATVAGTEVPQTAIGDDGAAVSLDVSIAGASAESVTITIRKATLTALKTATASLSLKTDIGTLIFIPTSISEIAASAGENDAVLTVKKLASSENATAQALITAGQPVYEITLTAGGTPIFTGANSGSVSIVLPYTRQGTASSVNVKVYRIDGSSKTDMNAGYTHSSQIVAFSTKHFSLYSVEEESKPISGGGTSSTPSASTTWDGVSVDVSWYSEGASSFTISSAAQLAGLAAIVNGLVNDDCVVYLADGSKISAATWNSGANVLHDTEGNPVGTGGSNKSTPDYAYGKDDFHGKTVKMAANLDMSAGNYMPIGGQYLMTQNDSDTKISSSFCGTFDGDGHTVTLYADHHCSTGNYGDGQSVGLIGRLGVHDDDPATIRPVNPTVRNVVVYGYIKANRSVGGIVGKIGKTSYNNGDGSTGGIIENCANFATIVATDAKGTGGIVGASWNGGIVRNCYNAGSVTGGYPAGGIVGSNEITVENCYNIGTVESSSGDSFAMALGTNNGGASYATHIINSYFLAGSAPGGGYYDGSTVKGTGFEGAEMKKDAFVATLNGEDGTAFVKDTKGINNGYPVLAFQGGTAVAPGTGDTSTDTPEAEAPTVIDTEIVEAETTVTTDASGSVTATTEVKPEDVKTAVDAAVKAVEEAKANGETNVVAEVKIDAKTADPDVGATVTKAEVDLNVETLKTVADAKDVVLTIETDAATITLDNATLESLIEGKSSGEKVAITVEIVDNAEALNAKQQAAVGDNPVLDLSITVGSAVVHDLGGTVTVTVPFTPKSTVKAEDYDLLTVYYLDDDGNIQEMKNAKYDPATGEITFTTTHFSKFFVAEWISPFSDVVKGSWYYRNVRFAYSNGLFEGVGDGKFAPNSHLTRAMLITILARDAGVDTTGGATWYEKSVAWGVATGITDGSNLNGDITREQLVTMLYRYAKLQGKTVTASANLAGYTDAALLSDWAEDAMKWAVASGLVEGRTDTTLAPVGSGTRAEAATILQRFIEKIVK